MMDQMDQMMGGGSDALTIVLLVLLVIAGVAGAFLGGFFVGRSARDR